MTQRRERTAITREAALIDAAMTVQRWRCRLGVRSSYELRIRRYIGRCLDCPRTWDAIQTEIVRRHLADDGAARQAA